MYYCTFQGESNPKLDAVRLVWGYYLNSNPNHFEYWWKWEKIIEYNLTLFLFSAGKPLPSCFMLLGPGLGIHLIYNCFWFSACHFQTYHYQLFPSCPLAFFSLTSFLWKIQLSILYWSCLAFICCELSSVLGAYLRRMKVSSIYEGQFVLRVVTYFIEFVMLNNCI